MSNSPQIHNRNLTDLTAHEFSKLLLGPFGSLGFRSILRDLKILWFSVVVDFCCFFTTAFIKQIRCFRCCVRNVLNFPYQGLLRTTYYENHPNRNGITVIEGFLKNEPSKPSLTLQPVDGISFQQCLIKYNTEAGSLVEIEKAVTRCGAQAAI